MAELKPCPFCGGTAHATYVTDFRITSPRTGRRINCDVCSAQTGAFATEEEAAEVWNRRAADGVLVVDQRQRFEAWADDQGFPLKKLETSDGYLDLRTEGAWEAWQAALALGVPGLHGGGQ